MKKKLTKGHDTLDDLMEYDIPMNQWWHVTHRGQVPGTLNQNFD